MVMQGDTGFHMQRPIDATDRGRDGNAAFMGVFHVAKLNAQSRCHGLGLVLRFLRGRRDELGALPRGGIHIKGDSRQSRGSGFGRRFDHAPDIGELVAFQIDFNSFTSAKSRNRGRMVLGGGHRQSRNHSDGRGMNLLPRDSQCFQRLEDPCDGIAEAALRRGGIGILALHNKANVSKIRGRVHGCLARGRQSLRVRRRGYHRAADDGLAGYNLTLGRQTETEEGNRRRRNSRSRTPSYLHKQT